MTDRDLLKQALEALVQIHPGNMTPMAEEAWNKAIVVLRERLAQPEQEPVAWMTPRGALYRTEDVDGCFDDRHTPLYTAPPRREWVGLTGEEWIELGCRSVEQVRIGLATEAKLREKNAQ